MQHPFSCLPATFDAIESTISQARLERYLPAAKGDKHLALRLYVWNARLCEALYLPFQLAEVSSRNAVQKPVGKRFGPKWYESDKFRNILSDRMKDEIDETVKKEKAKRNKWFTENHVVAGLSFGFWVRLMTSSYDKQLWANGVVNSFPNVAKAEGRPEIHARLERLRKFRNDVAHHVAIFDKNPNTQFQNSLHLINLVCSETHWLTTELARVNQIINSRPT